MEVALACYTNAPVFEDVELEPQQRAGPSRSHLLETPAPPRKTKDARYEVIDGSHEPSRGKSQHHDMGICIRKEVAAAPTTLAPLIRWDAS
jgi:hypothetical protein